MPNGDSSGVFTFSIDKELVGKSDVKFDLQATQNPDVLFALAKNKPFKKPASPVIFGGADFFVQGGKDVTVGSDKGNVTFSASAGTKLGLFAQPGELRDGIVDGGDLAESIESVLSFNSGSTEPFLLFRWGYDLKATASGAVALGPAGTLNFSANAGRTGLYAVARQMPRDTGGRDAVASLLQGARLPRQVKTVADLAPATWIIAETDSSLGLKVGIKFGQDFTWIRETAVGTLSGDIGLKVAAGVSASLGFNATHKYAVLLSRDSANASVQKLRLRIFKLKMNNTNATFGAKAIVSPVATLLPESADDFIAGVVGTHSNQIMAALGRFDDWTDPDEPFFGPFLELGAEEAKRVLAQISGVADVVARFNQVRDRIQELFEAWHNLPADVTSRVMRMIEANVPLDDLRRITTEVRDFDQARVRTLIRQLLKDHPFLLSEPGQVLEKLAVDGLFDVLNNDGRLDDLQKRAGDLLRLLDGSAIEDALRRVQTLVSDRLHLGQIERAVELADPAALDPWLRARLEHFLEEKLVGAAGVQKLVELRANLVKVRQTLPKLYEKARAALERDYSFSITAALSRTTTETALVDLEFDFAGAGPEVTEALRVALLGQFEAFMDRDVPGVTVHEAQLTHGVKRESSVEVIFPFFRSKDVHTNEALTSLSRVAQSGGRVFYQTDATDLVSVKNSHTASLTVSMQLLRQQGQDVRLHNEDRASYRQTLDQVFLKSSTEDLIRQSEGFVGPLFAGEFGSGGYAGWLTDAFGAGAQLGHALTALDVTLPPRACLAWLNASTNKRDPLYQRLSMALQRSFKQLVYDAYFADLGRYEEVAGGSAAFSVLVFSSLPDATDTRDAPNGDLELAPGQFDSFGEFHWNSESAALRKSMVAHPQTTEALRSKLTVARARLQQAGASPKLIGFYKNSELGTILGSGARSPFLQGLLVAEFLVVKEAQKAAMAIAAFQAGRNATTSEGAIKAITSFGSALTNAFNAQLRGTPVGDALLPLGSLMFAEAAKVFDPSLQGRASAMFTVIDVKDTVMFPPARFPDHEPLKETEVVRAETLVHEVRPD